MLEVSSLRLRSPPTPCPPSPSGSKTAAATDPPQHELIGFVGGDHGHGHGHAAGFPTSDGGFMDDTDSLLLDYIDFSSCDVVVPFFDADGDVLPDLEADPMELLADFSPCPPDADDDDLITVSPAAPLADNDHEAQPPEEQDQDQDGQPMEAAVVAVEDKKAADEEQRWLLGAHDDINASRISNHEKVVKEGEEEEPAGNLNLLQDHQQPAGPKSSSSSAAADEAGQHHTRSKKKPPPASNASKRKVKVDWTPELHRRFVQAVEQLGIDKAVPSRILEIMGIQCLTRHNIASHLQKYRSHRKHLMAREAEAASWAQKRHMYAAAAAPTMMRNNSKQHLDVPPPSAAAAGPRPWVVPTIGFPPPAPFCRPLHVWGHPPATCGTAAATVEAAAAAAPPGPGPTMMMPLPVPVWPRHLARPTAAWAVDPAAYWHQHYTAAARKWGPPPQPAAGTPCVPPPMPMPMQLPRFPHPAVPTTMYTRPAAMAPPPPPTTTSKLAELQLPLDAHPSKESIDAAIGDVLVKPWLPLPLGLKPPSLDSVMSELHRHGIPKVPPAAARGEP